MNVGLAWSVASSDVFLTTENLIYVFHRDVLFFKG